MPKEFARSGMKIVYPDDWSIETEDTEDGWTTSIYSKATAFLMLTHYPESFDPSELADMALEATRETYPGLDSEEVIETLASMPTVGYNVNFMALDLTNSCWIRSLAGPEGCLLLMSQCTDEEIETNGEVLRIIRESISFDDEGEAFEDDE